jgi:hypothetical protein
MLRGGGCRHKDDFSARRLCRTRVRLCPSREQELARLGEPTAKGGPEAER